MARLGGVALRKVLDGGGSPDPSGGAASQRVAPNPAGHRLLPAATLPGKGVGKGVPGPFEAKAPGMDRARRLAMSVAWHLKKDGRPESGHGGRLGKRKACRRNDPMSRITR